MTLTVTKLNTLKIFLIMFYNNILFTSTLLWFKNQTIYNAQMMRNAFIVTTFVILEMTGSNSIQVPLESIQLAILKTTFINLCSYYSFFISNNIIKYLKIYLIVKDYHIGSIIIKTLLMLISGKKIIDLSRIIAGPYATMVLADFGCQIIKIEPPQGDPTRLWGPPWVEKESAYFLSINRNKKSLVLNLKEQKCRQVLYRLVKTSDAVIQNFVPGVTQKLGIDYQTLSHHNPNLVYCSISGFGDIGRKKNYPAFDNLIQAQTGFMHLTGEKDGDPYKLGFAIADVVTSLYASNALLSGLIYQMQTGKGIHLKTSLYECAVSALINQGSNYLNGGINPGRLGNHHPNIVPYGLYKTKTLPIVICVGTPQQYQSLKSILHLQDKQEFKSNQLRVKNREHFDKILNASLSNYTLDEAINLLQENKVPCGRVNDLKSLFQGNTVKDLNLVKQVGNNKFVRSPIRTSQNNIQDIKVPPKLNENGQQILRQLGLSQEEIHEISSLNYGKK